uniref:Uncharacterized protein n=1 Tax=viral metagenome TaxID=1070528 RepID=A0A6M3ILT1_9ZZZZ
MPNDTPMMELQDPDALEVEVAMTIRDLLNESAEVREFWGIITTLVRTHSARITDAMARSTPIEPMYDTNGSIAGYRQSSISEQNARFHRVRGEVAGLEWLEDEISRFRNLAMEVEAERTGGQEELE